MWALLANSAGGGKTRVSWRTLVIDPLLLSEAMFASSRVGKGSSSRHEPTRSTPSSASRADRRI